MSLAGEGRVFWKFSLGEKVAAKLRQESRPTPAMTAWMILWINRVTVPRHPRLGRARRYRLLYGPGPACHHGVARGDQPHHRRPPAPRRRLELRQLLRLRDRSARQRKRLLRARPRLLLARWPTTTSSCACSARSSSRISAHWNFGDSLGSPAPSRAGSRCAAPVHRLHRSLGLVPRHRPGQTATSSSASCAGPPSAISPSTVWGIGSPRRPLIALAQRRLPQLTDRFSVANGATLGSAAPLRLRPHRALLRPRRRRSAPSCAIWVRT